MNINKNDMKRLYELKGKAAWENAWTWIGNDTKLFCNRMERIGVFKKCDGIFSPTAEFIDFIKRKEFVKNSMNVV